jgi:hypothetical protein
MNREAIIRMGLEAGMRLYCDSWTVEDDPDSKNPKQISTSHLERFAALVAAAERRNCVDTLSFYGEMSKDDDPEWSEVAFWCCSRINNPIQTDKTFAVNYKEIDNVREKV